MRISEIFESWQGEYPSGVPALFIRLQGCNRHCEWCDTKNAQDDEDAGTEYEVHDLVKRCKENHNKVIVITGGEPFNQANDLMLLCSSLPTKEITIETNGDFLPEPWFYDNTHLVVSPKAQHIATRWLSRHCVLKIVIDVTCPESFLGWLMWAKVELKTARDRGYQPLVFFMPMSKPDDSPLCEIDHCRALIRLLKRDNLGVGYILRAQKVFDYK